MTYQERMEAVKAKLEELGVEYKVRGNAYYIPVSTPKEKCQGLFEFAIEHNCSWDHIQKYARKIAKQQWSSHGPTVAYAIVVS